MSYSRYYRDRAEEAEREAAAASLVNVRVRHLQSAEVWNEMAARAEYVERLRASKEVTPAVASG